MTNGVNGYFEFNSTSSASTSGSRSRPLRTNWPTPFSTRSTTPRQIAELEAESVAFIVSNEIGIQSDDWSFGLALGADDATSREVA